jgi:hypothetical protein
MWCQRQRQRVAATVAATRWRLVTKHVWQCCYGPQPVAVALLDGQQTARLPQLNDLDHHF